MRGLAALAVFQLHFKELFGGLIFPHAYLAVDFFFMLSGFVLATAYQERLDDGWSTLSFLKARAIRLYPLYLLGLIVSIWLSVVSLRTAHATASAKELVSLFLLGLFMIPCGMTSENVGSKLFPLNPPAWSLFYELLANLVHTNLLRRRSPKILLLITVLSGCLLARHALALGTMDFGADRSHSLSALWRVLFSYSLGLLLVRAWKHNRSRIRVSPLIPVCLLVTALAAGSLGERRAIYDVVVTLLVLPLILLLGAGSAPGPRFVRLFQALGASSYAMYVLHYPLGRFFRRSWELLLHRDPLADAPWPGVVALALTVTLAILADRYYDLPVRAWLGRKKGVPQKQPDAPPPRGGTLLPTS